MPHESQHLSRIARCLVATCLLLLTSCASTGSYTWFHDLPRGDWESPSGQYLIGSGDTLNVVVYEQPSLTTRGRIRSDGKVALPFIGEVVAVGKAPTLLAQEIEGRLKQFIVTPRVTVNVEESPPLVVSVIGEVRTPGNLTLQPGAGVLQALAQAGGPSDFADRSAVFVLRRLPESRRIRFHYDELTQDLANAASFPLRNGDAIIVE